MMRSLAYLVAPFIVGCTNPEMNSGRDGVATYDSDSGSSLDASESDSPAASIQIWGKNGGFGGEGSDDSSFSYPSGIALSDGGLEIYILDSGNERIKVVSRTGELLRMWQHRSSATCLGPASSLAVGMDGTVYAASDRSHGVIGYAPDGAVRFEWSLVGAGSYCSYVGHSHGLAIDTDGNVLVAEGGVGEVQVYSPAGDLVRTFGRRGTTKGEFRYGPTNVTRFGEFYYVSDSDRILQFDSVGDFVKPLLAPMEHPFKDVGRAMALWQGWIVVGQAEGPPGFFAVDPNVQSVTHFWEASNGILPGELNIVAGLAISDDGTWYVTESYNHRVQVFRVSWVRPR